MAKPPIKEKYIETPEKLWELFMDYVKSLEIIKIQQPHVKLGIVELEVKEPMTMEGFKVYGHSNGFTLKHYIDNTNKKYDAYCPILTHIKDTIFKNNFSRAAVGLYKEALIAKQLGLKEKIEQTTIEQPLFPEDK